MVSRSRHTDCLAADTQENLNFFGVFAIYLARLQWAGTRFLITRSRHPLAPTPPPYTTDNEDQSGRGKPRFGRPRPRWKSNVKIDLRERVCKRWIGFFQLMIKTDAGGGAFT
jgi:hypothetical protein